MIASGYILSLLYAGLCVLLAGILYKFGVPKHITRKVVHILVGFEWVILYHFVGTTPHFLAVCLIVTLLLAVEYRIKLLPMMSSDSDNAPGTVYYAVAMSVMSLVMCFEPDVALPFGIGVFCTSFGDGFAALAGAVVKRHNPKILGSKSLVGTLTAFTVSFASAFTISRIYSYPLSGWHCLAIAALSAAVELAFGRGLDNIAITLSTSALAYAFVYVPGIENYLVPILLTPLFIAFAYGRRALTLDGTVAAILIDISISLSLGNFGFTVLIAFFVGSVVTDKIKKHSKKTKQKSQSSECRDSLQVMQNGFSAALAATLYLWIGHPALAVAFVASLAEAFADTAASGVGTGSPRVYDPFRRRPCEPGESGGMSIRGTLAAVIASAIIALIAFSFGSIDWIGALIALGAGILGAVFDSLLGSLLQVRYKCSVCGKKTEYPVHCDSDCTRVSGIPGFGNGAVNLASTVFSAALAGIVYFLIV